MLPDRAALAGFVHVDSGRFGRRREEQVLLALGALQQETVALLQERQVSETVHVSARADVRQVTEITQGKADHVDRQNLFSVR